MSKRRTKVMRTRMKMKVFMVFTFLSCDGGCTPGSPVVRRFYTL